MLTIVLITLVIALVFEYINGFHDTANSIATTVSTKVLTPRQAVFMATCFNLIGAMAGETVAKTISKGLVDAAYVGIDTILAALLGAIIWNLLTWWLGLPSSSSHALIGGLCGATLASAHGNWSVIIWSTTGDKGAAAGLWPKVVLPMFTSPAVGFIIGALLMGLLVVVLHKMRPLLINKIFSKLQLLSAAWISFSHGANDAQKTMGIIALILFTATNSAAFNDLPPWLEFLRTSDNKSIATWIKVACALTMAAGTAAGGWRIIRTMGHKIVRMQPIHGFAAQTTAATVISIATHWGIPLSTTHVISTSIMGVGATKRLSAVKWGVVGRIVWAWVLTIPVTALLAYWLERGLMPFIFPGAR